jgi:signal transduction histidine kinase
MRRLAGSLAHNVNNALTGVIGYVELGLRHSTPGTELHKHLNAGLTCAHRAAESVKRVLAFAFRATGPGAMAPLALLDVAEQVAEPMRAQQSPKVNVIVIGEGPGWVRACDPLVRTALEQLARNAVEAMPSGGTLLFRVHDEVGRRCLTLLDTGEGMQPEVFAQLFEPFLTTKPAGHLGLGLVLCREMIEAQGGTLQINSEPGRGTAVTMSFPPLVEVSTPKTDAASVPRADERQPNQPSPHWSTVPRSLAHCTQG